MSWATAANGRSALQSVECATIAEARRWASIHPIPRPFILRCLTNSTTSGFGTEAACRITLYAPRSFARPPRSEERRVGKEGVSRGVPIYEEKTVAVMIAAVRHVWRGIAGRAAGVTGCRSG